MKVPLTWLREFVDVDLPPEELAHRLTMSGTEVGSIDVIGGTWDNVFVAQVDSIDPHPNADRLKLATVTLHGEQVTVVCGAPNIAAGQLVAFARVGACLVDPRTGDIETLRAATIRGVESAGMVCSERELALGDDHAGILVLPEDAPIGATLSEYLGDVVFDLEVTPNRPDCMSILGIAREVAALTGATLREPDLSYAEEGEPVEGAVSVEIVDASLCPRYTASVIRGVQVGPSPRWMQDRLLRAGQRPINNVVDVTNYVMLEMGQPLHAFDFDTVAESRIVVRPAGEQEPFVTLDEAQHVLRPPMLVIADGARSVALAGVMGGLNTEMTDATTSVLLESANFNPVNTRRTSQALRLRSESSSRFEKGLQPELAEAALRRATRLILEVAGGTGCQGIADAYPQPAPRPTLRFTLARVRKVLGVDIDAPHVYGILTSLGFGVTVGSDGAMHVEVPYWRSDIAQEDDLVEEVARITGYDELPTTMISTPVPHRSPQPEREARERVRDLMVECGMQETISYSLTSAASLETSKPADAPSPLRVANPMSSELEYLRTTLRSGVLSTLAANRQQARDGVRLFEMGRVYLPREADLPLERETLVGVLAGPRSPESWQSVNERMDFFDAKGVVEMLMSRLRLPCAFQPAEDALFMPGRCSAVLTGDAVVGVIGEVHPRTLEQFDAADEAVALFELDVDAITSAVSTEPVRYRPIARYPGALRDLAVVLDAGVPAAQVQAIIERETLVSHATLFDVYEGAGVATGKRSLAYRVLFQAADRTLVGDEVSRAMEGIVAALEREVGASLRG
ncbi:MAG: phenylalanine--tRNA ligase subunit beta [Chloroflexota bacterium]|nr:phenylalanine--tRNA ligase subunit beta [Chloroflexota bacterium]MDE2941781.1 phenylalanine--tRNA ligase subunit beta [Chloroflexota bacterium]MDE3266845.1 phenylalanine--tRNA ligase subunit beta [Chloroflexota bacterium]